MTAQRKQWGFHSSGSLLRRFRAPREFFFLFLLLTVSAIFRPRLVPTTLQHEQKIEHRLENFTVNLNVFNQFFEVESYSDTNPGNATDFAEKNCDLQGQDWYPSGEDSWQQQAPRFMLIGAKKAGTTSFAAYLKRHPNIISARSKELLFFDPRKFSSTYVHEGKVLVRHARRDLVYRNFEWNELRRNQTLITFDATPGYLYYSAIVPRQLLCVCPWIQLLVILRDPVERLWSNYHFLKDRGNGKEVNMSFEEWVYSDLERLLRFGLIGGNNHDASSTSLLSSPMDIAETWANYTISSGEGPVGRGMYALQLQHWFEALREVGREPRDSFLIVRLEDMKKGAASNHTIFNRAVQWLGLSPHQLEGDKFDKRMVTDYDRLGKPVMDPKTKKTLQAFYTPHNQQLSRLLGDEWNDVWDYSLNNEDPGKLFIWPPATSTQEAE